MSLLFKNLRVHQVFGANTDVGKTILTSALVRASATSNNSVYYLKPVSTGPLQTADDEHVKRYAGAHKNLVHAHCLYRFSEPLSPHLAARIDSKEKGNEVFVPSDETFVKAVANHIKKCASRSSKLSHMYVETAGGVHSPTLSGTTQADSYRPLFLPIILIGDSKLGGISATISAYESLVLRGYIVDCILLFQDEYYKNGEYLSPYFAERGIHVSTFNRPPPRLADETQNFNATEQYYQKVVPSSKEGSIFDILEYLDSCHSRRIEELHSMPRRTLDSVWWPFVQHGLVKGEKDVNIIDSARGDFFSIYNGHRQMSSSGTGRDSLLEPQFDGSASWWTQALGHAHPALTMAAARAAGRYGHVMFPQATHLPALRLAERLVKNGPGKGWASRAFFSDDGATGMEIALKMALRYFSVQRPEGFDPKDRKNLGVLGLKGSYHGDTIGAMDACEEGVYTCEWHNAKGYWFDPPYIAIRRGKVHIIIPSAMASDEHLVTDGIIAESLSWTYNIEKRLKTPLANVYRKFIESRLWRLRENGMSTLAALVMEPLVMGAGGMVFVDPLFQRILVDAVRDTKVFQKPGLPVIFDEVFVGLFRLGMQGCGPLLGVDPDISVNAKILTGGLVPLAVTLASDSIFEAFLSDNKTDALLHGHSYTAHAVGCEVANETLRIVEQLSSSDEWKATQERWINVGEDDSLHGVWSFWDCGFVEALSQLEVVKEVMTLGTLLVIKTHDSSGYSSSSAQTLLNPISALGSTSDPDAFGMHFRTLGNVAYFMTSLNTTSETIRLAEDKIWNALSGSR